MTFGERIRAETERETRRSRFRDRASGQRIHPIEHDIGMVLDFVMHRRQRQAPGAFDAARRALRVVDTGALRFLVSVVLEKGRSDRVMKRRCERVLGYCDIIDAALALKGELTNGPTH